MKSMIEKYFIVFRTCSFPYEKCQFLNTVPIWLHHKEFHGPVHLYVLSLIIRIYLACLHKTAYLYYLVNKPQNYRKAIQKTNKNKKNVRKNITRILKKVIFLLYVQILFSSRRMNPWAFHRKFLTSLSC